MKCLILLATVAASLSGCVVEPPRAGFTPVVVRPATIEIVPVLPPGPYFGPYYGPRYGWR